MEYNLLKPWETLDQWQKEYIEFEGDSFLLCGRQSGKSTAASIKAVELAVNKHQKGEDILIIATTERQAYNLFSKCLSYSLDRYPKQVLMGKDKPTKHEIKFRNGVKIMCHPTGLQGEGLRGFTIKRLIADEASRMDREIFVALLPALSVIGGAVDLLSTPCGKQGYYYEASQNPQFSKWYISAEDCPRHSKEFLEGEKRRMSAMEYQQEYCAVFLDDLRAVFSEELIKKCCILMQKTFIIPGRRKYFMGVDIARMGTDSTAYAILTKIDNDNFEQCEALITKKQLTTQTSDNIIRLEKMYNFKQIGIDDGGVGAGVFDMLLREKETKNKTIALNNSRKPLDSDEKSKRRILKEDMYMCLLSLMEKEKIKLLKDDEVIDSLKSVQYEYVTKENQPTRFRIFGTNTHMAEALVRACWIAVSNKHLNLWAR